MAALLLQLLLLAIGVSVQGQFEDQWSGFVNDYSGIVDFLCPNNSVLTGIASDFSTPDRRWEFRCGTAERLASTDVTCSLQPPINIARGDISYSCPNQGYLGGLRSEFSFADSDRVWQPYCCSRPFSSLINCQLPSGFQNDLRQNLNYTAPPGFVLAGISSFYFSRDRRWQFQVCQIEVNCGDPGTPLNGRRLGDNFLFTSNVTFVCDDGYYQSSGPVGGVRQCLISGEWSDEQPVCSRCGHIENCAQVLCTNSTDHYCQECEGNHVVAMAYSNLGNECEPRCSWLRAFCFPGVCPTTPTSCECLDGFTGPDCLQITERATVSSCVLTLQDSTPRQLPADCRQSNQTSSPSLLYTNIVPTHIQGVWQMMYAASNISSVSEPVYVQQYMVGVAVAEFTATIYRASNPMLVASQTTHFCQTISPDNPVPGQTPCTVEATPTSLVNHTFLHGDTLDVQVRVSPGGYLDIFNLDSNESSRYYYDGVAAVQGVVFVIDLRPPVHCSLETPPTCGSDQERLLSLNGEIVNSDNIVVSWGGWTDIPSGVMAYQLIVHHLEESGGLLREGAVVESMPLNHTHGMVYEVDVVLPSEGPFSFILEVLDVAGNMRLARRVAFYDNSSLVATDAAHPLVVSSAVPQSGYLWQNSTTLPIIVGVAGHFYNSLFRSSDLLAPLANFSAPLLPEYDQPLTGGQLPREGTPNSLGVVRLHYDYAVDQLGGVTLDSDTPPPSFRFSITPELESVTLQSIIQDGDSVRIWLQAEDYRSQLLTDSILVHFDSSSPVLDGLVLVRNGIRGLSQHWSETLTSLEIQFDVLDSHSGVMELEWSIGNETGLNNVGYGLVSVSRVANCSMIVDGCVCDILGRCTLTRHSFSPQLSDLNPSVLIQHDATYYVTITATNHAHLSSSVSLTFTIDATPPLEGVVLDGPSGGVDVDYQSNMTLRGWWAGFIDRETGIRLYQYQFSSECLNASHFTFPLVPGSSVTETTEEYATMQSAGEGVYYLTVVAWNSVLSPSAPVCSDGLTVDLTPPTFEGVSVPGIRTEGGVAILPDGEVWLVGRDRTRKLVEGGRGNSSCVAIATAVSDLSTYPIGEGENSVSVEACLSSRPLSSSPRLVITQDHTLNFTWRATDNVGMRDFYVSLYSAAEFSNIADISTTQVTTRTGGFAHLSLTNSDLLRHGNSFYLLVRGEDVSGLMRTVEVGPVLVDQTPPTINGSVWLDISPSQVTVVWDNHTFSDPELGDDIVSLQYAIGLTRYGEEVTPYRPLPLTIPAVCPAPSTSCFSFPISSLSLVAGQSYYITMAATNLAGLTSLVAASNTYRHAPSLPSPGLVLDLDPSADLRVVGGVSYHRDDVDVTFNSQELGVRWAGFSHPSDPVNLYLSLGTGSSLGDVVEEVPVDQSMDQYVFINLSLIEGAKYYTTVVAETSAGRVNASSNGVTYLGSFTSAASVGGVSDGLGEEDSDYQVSSSIVSARWSFPGNVQPFITHYMWAVVRDNISQETPVTMPGNSGAGSGSAEDNTTSFVMEAEFRHVGGDEYGVRSVSGLEVWPVRYRSVVRACIADTCLSPVYSDGFYVATPPRWGVVNATYTPLNGIDSVYGTSSYGQITVRWAEFEGVFYFEWRLLSDGLQLLPWTQGRGQEMEASLLVNETVSLHRRLQVEVRAVNSVGLTGTSMGYVEWNVDGRVVPQHLVPRAPLVVYDVEMIPMIGEGGSSWQEVRHVQGEVADEDYVSHTSLSAVWPNLRYMEYSYSVSSVPSFTECPSVSAISCGSTHLNYATVTSQDLRDSHTYYFCVRAQLSDAIHPTSATPTVLEVCSNGVTLDLTLPLGSCFKVVDQLSGNTGECSAKNESVFQVSTSTLHLLWAEFADQSGIANYSYAIGLRPYEGSVLNYTSVGVATSVAVQGLSLQSGSTYYASLQAVDFAGGTSLLATRAVTIDTSPPIVTGVRIEIARASLSLEWDELQDQQSGIQDLEWALGTRPGSSDVSGWNEFTWNGGTSIQVATQGLPLYEGQRLFATIKVRNSAGLVTVASSRGTTLDLSPPDPGVVFDGPPPPTGEGDVEYWQDVGRLSAHWTSFTDPHSTIVGYWWAIGRCHGCTDIQPLTPVGLKQSSSASGLSLEHGGRYYVTVRACNSVGLCSQATSNGVTVDVTPPTSGRVYDGPEGGGDLQYQTSP